MSTDIKIKKGLNIKLKGEANQVISSANRSKTFAVNPPEFKGILPKLAVKEGEKVNVGDAVFHAKSNDQIKIVSPVSGVIKEVVRGAKRKILSIKITADDKDTFVDFGSKNPSKLAGPQVKEALLESGCWPMIQQRPYDIVANPEDSPKAIFISAYATAPLAASHILALEGREKEFQAGIDALAKLTEGKVHLSVGTSDSFLNQLTGVELHKVTGKHPAGNVGIQIAHVDPINSGDRVWVVNPQDVASIGSLFLTGKYNPSKVIALAGSQVDGPQYYSLIQGTQLKDIVAGKLKEGKSRMISGNPLTGEAVGPKDALGFYHDSVSVIPEGDHYEFFGWMPFVGNHKFSASRTFFSWLSPNKEYDLDTNLNGEERAFVITGEMEKVMPMDIYPMQLLKAAMIQDIEKMENLGIYEVAPEDFALIDFVSTSKIEAQQIIREGLDLMIKEVG
ncbi:Na(+)-translocating NADH-quinone reductase subunit A [Lutimonas sp.]|uniref:Na(+)-translocating NADH-quinone reductase subunit A n=1 Tax=Lutimonas sp. TaxID=1872403 RepID=UPI003D9B03B8